MFLKFFILSFIVFAYTASYSQSNNLDYYRTDTFKIRYLVWRSDSTNEIPYLIQKNGYVVKFHNNNSNPIKRESEKEDIGILDDKKNNEKDICLRYIFL